MNVEGSDSLSKHFFNIKPLWRIVRTKSRILFAFNFIVK
jgi:hypothetical protein